MKKVALYARVSTDLQTVDNQLRVLHEVAERSGWLVVHIFIDQGISGAKGRDQRPGFDALLKAVTRREVDLVAAWSVDRLGRSLPDLVGFLSELQASGADLFLNQQGLDTSTPSGRLLFTMLAVFSDFERSMIAARVRAGQDRARSNGVRFGRPPLATHRRDMVVQALEDGRGIRATARSCGVSTASVQRIKLAMTAPEIVERALAA